MYSLCQISKVSSNGFDVRGKTDSINGHERGLLMYNCRMQKHATIFRQYPQAMNLRWAKPEMPWPTVINVTSAITCQHYSYFVDSVFWEGGLLVCDLNRTPVVTAKHGGSCVHFSGISTCRRTSRETDSHPQRPPLPTLYKISLPIFIIVTNIRLQPLSATWYNSLVLSFSLLKI